MARSDPLGFSVALVRSGFGPADYVPAEAFNARVGRLVEQAVDASPRPALIAFPELTGMWLPLLAGAGERVRNLGALAAIASTYDREEIVWAML